MKKNILAIVLGGVALSLLSGLIGAFAALYFAGIAQPGEATSVLRTQHLEVVGKDGKTKATLGYDADGVYLRLMSSEAKPILSMSVLENTTERKNQASAMGSLAAQYPYGVFSINDGSGRQVITIANPTEGHGQISFGSTQSSGKVTLGYFPTTDSSNDTHTYGAWGLRVLGRVNGSHVGTGIGILDTDGIDGAFLVPESPSQAQPLPKSPVLSRK
jgi:hypothetical protein